MPDESAARPSSRYAWYVVGVLMLLNVCSFVDRQILAFLVDPMKEDLGLTEVEVSILMGPAFAVTFSFGLLLVGPLADRFSRRSIIGLGVAFWSVMCAATGVANTFTAIFATRLGVGVGEATLTPSGHSLIADYFPPHKLATAMSVFTSGVFIGAGLSYLIGGLVVGSMRDAAPWDVPLLGAVAPWQRVFIVLGVAGLLLTLLVPTIREPARTHGRRQAAAMDGLATRSWMRQHAVAYASFGFGIACYAVVNYGTAFWFPAFFSRSHGWSEAKIGVYMGVATAVFGAIGTLAGGRLADWLKARGQVDGNLRVLVGSALISVVASFPLFLTRSEPILLVSLVVTNLVAAAPFGAAAAAAQEMTPPALRATAAGALTFVLNFIGLGLGPPLAAFLTERVYGDPAKVYLSLLSLTVVGRLLAAVLVGSGLTAHRRALAQIGTASASQART